MREDLLDVLCDIAVYMVGLGQIWPRGMLFEPWDVAWVQAELHIKLCLFYWCDFSTSCSYSSEVPTEVLWSVCVLNTWIPTPVNCRPQAVNSLEARWWRSHLHSDKETSAIIIHSGADKDPPPTQYSPHLTSYTARQIRPLSCFQLHDWWYSIESSRDKNIILCNRLQCSRILYILCLWQ